VRSVLEFARGRWLALSLFAVSAAMLVSAVSGERGLIRIRALEGELRATNEQNFQLVQAINSLRQKLRLVREDDATLERLARRRWPLVRDGEILYRIAPETLAAQRSQDGGSGRKSGGPR
jgi:cell division protein FtsB